jgi:putative transposase
VFPSPTSAGRLGSARRPISIGRRKYDGMQPPEMRRLKQLEDENGKLKKIVADLSLDREMLQDVIRRKL